MSVMHVDFTTPGFVHPGPSEAERFFYENAGWGYHPDRETPEQGRWRGAIQLATAERRMREQGWEVEWDNDDDAEQADAGTEWEDWPHYCGTLYDAEREVLGSLGSVMFADKGGPEGDTYSRVVAAELALEAMS